MSIKPYFWLKYTYSIKLDELEAPTKLDELEVFLFILEVPYKPIKPAEPTIKCSQGRPYKNPIVKNYLTSISISAK